MTRKWNPDVMVETRSELSPFRPHAHQTSAWDALAREFRPDSPRAGLLVLPTGAGKTFVAAHWLLANHIRNGGSVLWLAHRRGLLRQAARTFLTHANAAHPLSPVGLLTISGEDGSWAGVRPEHNIVLSSIQTAGRESQIDFIEAFVRMRSAPPFVVVDEAHHAAAPGYHRLLRELRRLGSSVLGLTATPVRMDDEDERRLHHLFDKNVVYQVTRRTLIEQGILATPIFDTVHTRIEFEREFTEDDVRYLERFGEIAPSVLSRLAVNAPRNAMIVRQYKENAAKYGPTVVFAADTLHAQTLSKEFQKAGINADYVDYSRGDSQAVIESYQAQTGPQVLINVEMLTEGFDAPHTRTVFIARPTRSDGLLSQMVGRALRGTKSGGNESAYLVTFVDTWKQFDVLDAEYLLREGGAEAPEPAKQDHYPRIEIPVELVNEAYRLVMGAVNADLTGVFQCLPEGWYAWEQTLDDDVRRRLVMVFEHQVEGWAALDASFSSAESVRGLISEDRARELVQEHFGDLPDPLPRWADIQALLEARQQGCEIHRYTFEQKRSFDPRLLAKHLVTQGLGPLQQRDHLLSIWEGSFACRSVYRNDFRTFQDEVMRAVTDAIQPPTPPPPPEIVRLIPPNPPRSWGPSEPGHSLVRIRDAVVENRRNFPGGAPTHGSLLWSRSVNKRTWGFCRYSDMSITINTILDSPDVPLFVLEFLMFHELLHADMPHANHNAEFRARERLFAPSADAVQKASAAGVTAGSSLGAWRALGDMFLESFEHRFTMKKGRQVSY